MNRQIYNQHLGLQDFEKMNPEEKILFRASSFRLPEGISTDKALTEMKRRISANKISKPVSIETKTRILWSALAIAASILILFGIWQVTSISGKTSISSEKGAHINYTLTDGSEIKLNSDSKISFNGKHFISDRQVNLKGEAFFEVKKGNSFRVSTPNGIVTVLGTSFNVFSRDYTFKVACISGKVMISSNNQSVTLNPGECSELEGENLKKYQNDRIGYVTGWINGEFYFENTPLNLVFNEIERQYNVKFVGEKRVDEYFTGSFVNKDLKTALEIVCIPMGLEYEIKDNGKISVSKKHK